MGVETCVALVSPTFQIIGNEMVLFDCTVTVLTGELLRSEGCAIGLVLGDLCVRVDHF